MELFKFERIGMRLFESITLLSNRQSFEMFMGEVRDHLWFLMHFNHLEIDEHRIHYQENRGVRQRKNTVYPKRRLRKKFKDTASLLTYLDRKPYIIQSFEIQFTNGWKIKMLPFVSLIFYTNSQSERDLLIQKCFQISGLHPVNIDGLKLNYTYLIRLPGSLELLSDFVLPDEFWTKEQLREWQMAQTKLDEYGDEETGGPF